MRVDSGSMLQAGLEGMRAGQQQATDAAKRIANYGAKEQAEGVNPGDFAKDAVELKLGENQVKASANVVKAADRSLGAMIDTFA